jgi:alpha-L-fucosidase
MRKTFSKNKITLCFKLLLIFCSIFTQLTKSQSSIQADSILNKKHAEFKKWKYGMFLHFNMGTFADKEWATGYEDPLSFNPVGLDCNQWVDVIKAAGMNYAVLTVKHTGGWCLWDSKYTTHDITAFRNYKNGNGDIVRDFVDACRKKDIKVGLYYCLPGDYSHSYGNSLAPGQKDMHGLPDEAIGDFEGFVEKQVTELLSNYGQIDLIWFDQYSNKYTGKYWLQLKALVNRLQPNCIVIGNNSDNYVDSDVIEYEYPYWKQVNLSRAVPPDGNKNVSELCDCIDANGLWFRHTGEVTLQSAEQIANMLNLCNSRSTNLLLDVPPNREGVIEDFYIKRLMEVKKIISE